MLIDRASVLTAKIEAVEGQQEIAGDAQQFSIRAESLHAPVRRLRSLLLTLEGLQRAGVPIAQGEGGTGRTVGQLASSIHRQFISLAEKYAANNESILEADGDMRWGFWNPLTELPDVVEELLKESWSNHVEQTIHPIPEEIVDALAVGSPEWKGLGELYAQIDAIQDKLPNPEILNEFEAMTISEHQLREQLGAGDDFQELEPFILKAHNGTADLGMVTEELKNRLSEKGILELFRVGISGRRT